MTEVVSLLLVNRDCPLTVIILLEHGPKAFEVQVGPQYCLSTTEARLYNEVTGMVWPREESYAYWI
jgi:hypothetical protein